MNIAVSGHNVMHSCYLLLKYSGEKLCFSVSLLDQPHGSILLSDTQSSYLDNLGRNSQYYYLGQCIPNKKKKKKAYQNLKITCLNCLHEPCENVLCNILLQDTSSTCTEKAKVGVFIYLFFLKEKKHSEGNLLHICRTQTMSGLDGTAVTTTVVCFPVSAQWKRDLHKTK